MLSDTRIKDLIDFPKSRDCFPGVDIAGGVCFFLWDRDYSGICNISSKIGDNTINRQRKLNEFDIFIRDNIGIDILKKVISKNEKMLSEKVLTRNSFGFTTSVRGKSTPFDNCVTLISSGGVSYVPEETVVKNQNLINHYKLSVGTLNPDRGGVNNAKDGKVNVTTKVKILKPKEVVTETYIIVDYYNSKSEAENCGLYLTTKFARFLVSLTLSSMHIVRENFQFVPIQDFSEIWSDEKLYSKYNLTEDEITFIESIIRPMDLSQNTNDHEE
jgi:site-specific DNA-methyltransferase (adenine-specific)